jgi:chaperone modulatory protein CbpM
MIQRVIGPGEGGLEGELLNDERTLTLAELSRCCGVELSLVRSMVAEGMLHPRGTAPEQWVFRRVEVVRVRRAVRLQHDLDVNLAGAALALELLEEIEQLRRRVRRLEGAAEQWADLEA